MIYSLYGQPESGKTTLGRMLSEHLGTPFIIDGDEFRSFFCNTDYGFGGRKKNIRAANAVATYLNKKSNPDGHVIMSLVNPYAQFRNELKEDNHNQVREILLVSDRLNKADYHVEDFEIGTPDHIINTDRSTNDTWKELKALLQI
tara:strand:+ start:104 stop:538 length:435 start_codon:yes stop_codon:yes gene_type:complete